MLKDRRMLSIFGMLATSGGLAVFFAVASGLFGSSEAALPPTQASPCQYVVQRTPTPSDPTQTPTNTPTNDQGLCPNWEDPAGDPSWGFGYNPQGTPETSYRLSNLPVWRVDVNNDGVVNSGDQAWLAQFITCGTPCKWVPAATVTPTFTSTATPTNTATPTAAAQMTFDEMIQDLTREHVSCVESAIYDFEFGPAIETFQYNESVMDAMTGWATIAWGCDVTTNANVDIEIQNFQIYGHDYDDPATWDLLDEDTVGTSSGWCQIIDAPTLGNEFIGTCDGGGDQEPDPWDMPNDLDRVLHPGTIHLTSIPAGTDCVFARYQARMSGSGDIYANAGADFWDDEDNSGAVVGRYTKLTGQWRWIAASSCLVREVYTDSPPDNS